MKLSQFENFIQVSNHLDANNLKDALLSDSDLRNSVLDFIKERSRIVGSIVYSYWDRYYLSKNQKEEMEKAFAEFTQMSIYLNLYLGKDIESLLDKSNINSKIIAYIDQIEMDKVEDFYYTLKGIPSHYLISSGSKPMESIPAIGYHNIFFDEIKIEKNDSLSWLTICYYSDSSKKRVINDTFVLNKLKLLK